MNSKLKYVLGALGILLIISGIWYFRSIVAYVLIAAAVSFIGQPLVYTFERIRFRGRILPRGAAAGLTLFCMWMILIAFFWVFIPLILGEANQLSSINVQVLYNSLEHPFSELQAFLQKLGYFQTEGSFQSYMTHKINTFLGEDYTTSILTGVTSALGNLIIGFFAVSFITYFFLKDSSLFSSGILMFVPDKYTNEVQHAMGSIRYLLSRYLTGIVIEVFCVMVLITIGLWWAGVAFQHALICGLLGGILNVIPYVGPWIGAAFGMLIGIATNLDLPFEAELVPLIFLMALVYVVTHIVDNIVFQPLIYSNSVKAHPLEIFIVILMAASLAGIIGMILAIPSYTVIRVIAKEFLSGFKVVKHLTKNI